MQTRLVEEYMPGVRLFGDKKSARASEEKKASLRRARALLEAAERTPRGDQENLYRSMLLAASGAGSPPQTERNERTLAPAAEQASIISIADM